MYFDKTLGFAASTVCPFCVCLYVVCVCVCVSVCVRVCMCLCACTCNEGEGNSLNIIYIPVRIGGPHIKRGEGGSLSRGSWWLDRLSSSPARWSKRSSYFISIRLSRNARISLALNSISKKLKKESCDRRPYLICNIVSALWTLSCLILWLKPGGGGGGEGGDNFMTGTRRNYYMQQTYLWRLTGVKMA